MRFIAEITDEIEPIVRLISFDWHAGIEKLRRLAEAGDKSAISFLGMYLSEYDENEAEALKWLWRAAQFGCASAAWNIAMTARQYGNTEAMKQWIDHAAELGEEDALATRFNDYRMTLIANDNVEC